LDTSDYTHIDIIQHLASNGRLLAKTACFIYIVQFYPKKTSTVQFGTSLQAGLISPQYQTFKPTTHTERETSTPFHTMLITV